MRASVRGCEHVPLAEARNYRELAQVHERPVHLKDLRVRVHVRVHVCVRVHVRVRGCAWVQSF